MKPFKKGYYLLIQSFKTVTNTSISELGVTTIDATRPEQFFEISYIIKTPPLSAGKFTLTVNDGNDQGMFSPVSLRVGHVGANLQCPKETIEHSTSYSPGQNFFGASGIFDAPVSCAHSVF